MKFGPKKMLLPAIGAAFAATGCQDDENKISQTDLLVGEWRLVEVNGAPYSEAYELTFEFQDDLDFSICSSYENSTYCYSGEWNWKDSGEDEVEMDYVSDGELYELGLKITKLDKTTLEGQLRNPDGEISNAGFEKQ